MPNKKQPWIRLQQLSEHCLDVFNAPRGTVFGNLKSLHSVAIRLGFKVTLGALQQRYGRGERDWNKLVKDSHAPGGDRCKAVHEQRAAAKAEMHELCKEIDRRKAEIEND